MLKKSNIWKKSAPCLRGSETNSAPSDAEPFFLFLRLQIIRASPFVEVAALRIDDDRRRQIHHFEAAYRFGLQILVGDDFRLADAL